jgi:hypothetical protein
LAGFLIFKDPTAGAGIFAEPVLYLSIFLQEPTMTPISLTLNATTEQHAIADFVNKILAQFKKTPNVMLQVHINDEPWVARDFIGGLYLTVGTVEQYQENKAAYEDLISEDITSPLYHEYFQHLRINGDVGETVSPILKGYEHNPTVMQFSELVDALTRLAAKY